MTHSFFDVELDCIVESQFNPRKTFDPQGLADLTASVKAQGVLQPILLRPIARGDGNEYEIVAGARRFRAAKAAGLETIPAIVRELDDREALEIALLENLQRADLPPLEEGRSFAALHKEHGFSAAELAAKASKSLSYVYGRMQLAELPPKAQQLLEDGKLQVAAALLVARIPDPKRAAEAALAIAGTDVRDPWPLNQVRRYIESHFMLDMAVAPFDPRDPDLVPAAGPCNSCPKRTCNQRDLFGEATGPDLCTDKKCWEAKGDAAWKQAAAAAKAAGTAVVQDAKGVATDYQDLQAVCPDDPKHRTYQALLGGKRGIAKLEERTLVRSPRTGAPELRLPKVSLRKVLREAGHDFWAKKKKDPQEQADIAERMRRARLDVEAGKAAWVRALDHIRTSKVAPEHVLRESLRALIDTRGADEALMARWAAFGPWSSLVNHLELSGLAALFADLVFVAPITCEIDLLCALSEPVGEKWVQEERARLESEQAAAAAAPPAKEPKAKKRAAKAGAK